MPYKLVHFMYNGILHVNTKINIIVMMKMKKNLSATKYVHKMSQKPYNEFPGKKCPQFHTNSQKSSKGRFI